MLVSFFNAADNFIHHKNCYIMRVFTRGKWKKKKTQNIKDTVHGQHSCAFSEESCKKNAHPLAADTIHVRRINGYRLIFIFFLLPAKMTRDYIDSYVVSYIGQANCTYISSKRQ